LQADEAARENADRKAALVGLDRFPLSRGGKYGGAPMVFPRKKKWFGCIRSIGRIVPLLFAMSSACIGARGTHDASANRPDSLIGELIAASTARKSLTESPIPSELPTGKVHAAAAIAYMQTNPDFSAYHLLFLLQRYSPNDYDNLPASVKGRILCSELANARYLNDWSYLAPEPSRDLFAAHAVLDVGKAALPYLLELMDDKRAAPLWGTEEATVSIIREYRRADFAYRYAMLILGRQATFPANVGERDILIARLKRDLSRRC
jgi:hypothetical protein